MRAEQAVQGMRTSADPAAVSLPPPDSSPVLQAANEVVEFHLPHDGDDDEEDKKGGQGGGAAQQSSGLSGTLTPLPNSWLGSMLDGPARSMSDGSAVRAELRKASARHRNKTGSQGKRPFNFKDIKPVFETFDSSVEERQLMTMDANIRLDPRLKDEQLKSANLEDLYQRAATTRRSRASGTQPGNTHAGVSGSELDRALAGLAGQQVTYQRLADCKEVVEPVEQVLQEARCQVDALTQLSLAAHNFEFCVLVDNSGSMATKLNATKVSLVVLCEVLRRLEWRFSVVRFGNRRSQRVIKGPADVMDDARGQLLLEALTCNEGTYPASACAYVADTIFKEPADDPQQQQAATRHRAVLLVVDGLTQERAAEDYRSALEPKGIRLLVLNIQDERQASLMPTITSLWQACRAQYSLLSVAEQDKLPLHLTRLITSFLSSLLTEAETTAARPLSVASMWRDVAGHKPGVLALPNIQAPGGVLSNYCHISTRMELLTPQQLPQEAAGSSAGLSLFASSAPGACLPLSETLHQLDAEATDLTAAGAADVAEVQARDALETAVEHGMGQLVDSLRRSAQYPAARQAAYEEWQKAAAKVSGQTQELVEPLSDLLSFNKFTRRTGGTRGTSLYMPEVMRAEASNWTGTPKIWGTRNRGGRRQHRVVILVDVSLSMHGGKAQAALECLVQLVEALQQLDVSWALMTFGERVTLVKSEEMAWDADTAYLAHTSLVFDQQSGTQDAAAVDLAVDLLSSRGQRGDKHVWVLTDGCGSGGPLHLARALQRAETARVRVVGLGVGLERTSVSRAYQHWVSALLPSTLPQALEQLGSGAGAGPAAQPAPDAVHGLAYQRLLASGAHAMSSEEMLRTQTQVFDQLVRTLNSASQLKVQHCQPDSMTIDLCFVIDCTGSMTAWLEACKAQIKQIAQAIVPRIQQDYSGLDVRIRYALVAYRDYNDAEPVKAWDFTEDVPTLTAQVHSLSAVGGGDIPEDILPALAQASQLDWQAKAKFLLLITDAPCHGRDCNDEQDDKCPTGSPSGLTVQHVMQQLAQQEVELMLCKVRQGTVDKMEAEFARHFNNTQTNRLLKPMHLFNSAVSVATYFHIVFVADESGSMSGSPWQDLRTAYHQLLQRRMSDQSQGDLISVVTFDTTATVRHTLAPSRLGPDLPVQPRGGGTDFQAGLMRAEQLLAQTPAGCTPLLIFMSDGCDAGGDPVKVMLRIRTTHAASNLQVHTIAFGSARVPRLEELARAGGGTHHQCQSGVDLATAMVNIAKGCTAVDGLVQRFGEILSDAVSLKVLVDYL